MDIGAISAAVAATSLTLLIRWLMVRMTHGGSVRTSDAETIFKASEDVRNDLASELLECRKERDNYAHRLEKCLEANRG